MAIEQKLNALLEWTWRNRVDIMMAAYRGNNQTKGQTHHTFKMNGGINIIYSRYGSMDRPANQELEPYAVRNFFDTLIRRVDSGSVECNTLKDAVIRFQTLNDETGALEFIQYDRLIQIKLLGENKTLGRYIHFIKPGTHTCNERVYLNLKERSRGTCFGGILHKIWHLDGLLSAKVAVPGSTKLDSAVIYCSDAKTRNSIIKIIKKYRKKRACYFNAELPGLVKSTGMPGVGHGAEPPSVQLKMRPGSNTLYRDTERVGQSFGFYRACLIFMALERTQFPEEVDNPRHAVNIDQRGRQQLSDFKQRVVEIFRNAGLSASQPHKQGDTAFDPYQEAVMPPPMAPPPPVA